MFPQPLDVEKMTLQTRIQDLDRELTQNMFAKALERSHKKQTIISRLRVIFGQMLIRVGERMANMTIDADPCIEEAAYPT